MVPIFFLRPWQFALRIDLLRRHPWPTEAAKPNRAAANLAPRELERRATQDEIGKQARLSPARARLGHRTYAA